MALVALGLALTVAASAEVQPPVHDVSFLPLPSSEREYAALGPVGPYYPQSAIRRTGGGVAVTHGTAVLDCQVKPDGGLDRCRIVSETPSGYGFGAAAKRMAERGRVRVADLPPGETTVRLRVPFDPKTPVAIAP